MAPPAIDYEALAKQAGAVSSTPPPKPVNYTALAKQAGAVSSTPAPVTPAGIDPSKVAGAGSMGLPGMPSAPNPVQQQINNDDVVLNKYHAGNVPLDQFNDQAGIDIRAGLKGAKDAASNWWNNTHGIQKVIAPVAGAAHAVTNSVLAPFSAIGEATDMPGLAGQLMQPINESSDQTMSLPDNTPLPPPWQPHPVAAAQRMFGGDPDKADDLEREGNTGGAAWERWGKPVAGYLAMEMGGKALRAGYNKLVPPEGPRVTDAFANLIAGGVKSGTPQDTAVAARPVWIDAAKQLGLKDEGSFRQMFTGATPTRNIPGQTGPLRNTLEGTKKILQVADKAVEIADKPMDAVMRVASQDVVDPNVRSGIVGGLLNKAAEASSVGNEATAKAYMQLAEKVKQQRTYGALDALKKNANNQVERMGAPGSISQQVAQGTTPIAAWQDLGGLIRENMYPVLQDRYIPKHGQPGWFDLADMGRREAAVIDARDGAYKAQELAAHQDAASGAMTAKEKATEGSLYKTHIARRLLGVNPTPAGQINKMFRRGLGELGGPGTPETVSTVPVQQPLALPPPPGSNIVANGPSGTPATIHVGGQAIPVPADVLHVSPDVINTYIGNLENQRGLFANHPQASATLDQQIKYLKALRDRKVSTEAGPSGPTTIRGASATEYLAQRESAARAAGNTDLAQKYADLAKKLTVPPASGYSETFPLPTMPTREGATGPATPMAQSYRGTVQVPNPDHTPLTGPSHFQQQQELGTTAGTIPDRTRGAQSPARTEADQVGMGHMPPSESGAHANNPRGLNPPTRSLTGPETLTKANFEQHFGTNAAPAIDRGTTGMLRTNDPAVATRALNAMDQYMRSDEFKGLDEQTRHAAKQQAAELRRQLVQHAAVQNMPGPVQYQVHWTPADLGKKAGRKVGVLRRVAAYTAYGSVVPPGKRKTAAGDEDETPEQEEERMRGPGDVAPPRKIRARDENGVLHEADAGTPLPPGWTVESGS